MKPLLVLILASPLLTAGDLEFNAIVRRVEETYGTKRMHIPMFGLANFALKIVRPAGASDIKLAIFEDFPDARSENDDFARIIEREMRSGWQPMVRVRSRHNQETTSIFIRNTGSHLDMLIATRESHEATIVQLRIEPAKLVQWLGEPGSIARHVIGERHGRDDEF